MIITDPSSPAVLAVDDFCDPKTENISCFQKQRRDVSQVATRKTPVV